jgi:hypothetical protein
MNFGDELAQRVAAAFGQLIDVVSSGPNLRFGSSPQHDDPYSLAGKVGQCLYDSID